MKKYLSNAHFSDSEVKRSSLSCSFAAEKSMLLFERVLKPPLTLGFELSSRLANSAKVDRDGEALISASQRFIQQFSEIDLKYINSNTWMINRLFFLS
jgi:hypothetical protein